MLNNFIYAPKKSLFTRELEAGNVLDEAIVFIKDTKEIWNHGTYFDCSTTTIKTINGESLLGSGDIIIKANSVSKINGLLNIKDVSKLENVWDALIESGESATYIITDENGNYPSPNKNTVYIDTADLWLDLFYRANGNALKNLIKSPEAYYNVIGSWTSQTVSSYVKLPKFTLQTAKVGDLVTIVRQELDAKDFYKNYLDYSSINFRDSLDTISRTAFNTWLSSQGISSSLSDGEIIELMIIKGLIYSCSTNPNTSGEIPTPLSVDGKVVLYTAQITPNTENFYSGEFWSGNMTGPGIYSYVTQGRPEGSDDGEYYTGYVSPDKTQTLVSMKDPSKAFTRFWNEELNNWESWISINYAGNYFPNLWAPSMNDALHTGVYGWIIDESLGLGGAFTVIVNRTTDIDGNNYETIEQTAYSRNRNGEIWKRLIFYKNDEIDGTTGWLRIDLNIEKINYSNLVNLKNQNRLIPGHKYEIIDYKTTAIGDAISVANRDFTIIVEALTENSLNHEACIGTWQDQEMYYDSFKNCTIKYDIDNDINKYAWADRTNGKGVIYYMKDSRGNEAPYDFKNILFNNLYTFLYDTLDGSSYPYMTYCYNNKISPCYQEGVLQLNNIVFLNISDSDKCRNNTFGPDCKDISFGTDCSDNTFSKNCKNITIGDECGDNKFGNDCADITLGKDSNRNIFESDCETITFDKNCNDNVIKQRCSSIVLGEHCSGNIFGTSVTNCTLGNDSDYNEFKSNCSNCSIKRSIDATVDRGKCSYITFEKNCSNVCLYNNKNGSDHLKYFKVKSGCKDINVLVNGLSNTYETTIATTSTGLVVTYCEADVFSINSTLESIING